MKTLWQSNLDFTRASLAHPFVRALADGSLDASLFRGYIVQDAFFLRAFAKAYRSRWRAREREAAALTERTYRGR